MGAEIRSGWGKGRASVTTPATIYEPLPAEARDAFALDRAATSSTALRARNADR
jgi:hypothetical protein